MPRKIKKPSYLHHKPSNRGRVRIDGRDVYLDGPYGSEESLAHYDDVVRDWLIKQGDVSRVALTVDGLSVFYMQHAEAYYQKDGEPTGEVECMRSALRLLVEFAGRTRARQFRPRQFRDSLVGKPDLRFKNGSSRTLSRQYINKTLRKIVRVFKWAASEEHVPVSVWHALTTVEEAERSTLETMFSGGRLLRLDRRRDGSAFGRSVSVDAGTMGSVVTICRGKVCSW